MRLDYPDLETVLMGWLPTVLSLDEIDTPNTPTGPIGSGTVLKIVEDGEIYVRIADTGSTDDGVTRRTLVDIDVFAPTRAVSYALAQQAHRQIMSARSAGGVLLDRVVTVSGPKRVPWDNTNTRRFLASYRISTRR